MRNNKKVLGTVVLASVLAATGSAFTAANTGANGQVGGYQAASVTGVAVGNVLYDYSDDRATLETVTYTLADGQSVPNNGTVIAEVNTNGGRLAVAGNWVTCATDLPGRATALDPIVCTLNLATGDVTSMDFVVRDSTSTPPETSIPTNG